MTTLKPSRSTHEHTWVYATANPAVAASFLARAGDFHLGIGMDDEGIFSITERYAGAFDLYKGTKGSIYKLSSEGFLSNQTDWEIEVINPKEVSVLEEFLVDNAFEWIKQLEAKGYLKLYYYPDRPSRIPVDDSDLIQKAVYWTLGNFPEAEEEFLQLHPHLKERFEARKTGK